MSAASVDQVLCRHVKTRRITWGDAPISEKVRNSARRKVIVGDRTYHLGCVDTGAILEEILCCGM